MHFLDELNDSQRKAAEHLYGASMVIAGAGSGKTRVLTFRIAHMIEKEIDPFNILALTFTNKAAREMTERIGSIVGAHEAKNITMGTFHSVFSKILRFNADRIGFPNNFTIYDTQDSKSVIKDIIKGFKLDDKAYKPSHVFGRISTAKNNLISPEAYCQNEEIKLEDKQARRPEMGRIYTSYMNRCQKSGAMDFDDLLYYTNVLLRDFPEVLHYYQHKFKYILVDEYQDTNYAQYLIIKKLAAAYENICVVGDDAQSIYSFRGANIENILNFRKDYPDFTLYKLEQNYRSTKTIVEAANSIIKNNKDQIHKSVWTDNQNGNKIKVIRTPTDNEEGRSISSLIKETQSKHNSSYNDFAVLYRTNRQSRSFEEALRKLNIPYKVYGGLSFYQRKEIKDLLAYFRLSANPNDEEALKRVINYPKRAIGKTSIEKLIVAANNYSTSMWEIICDFHKYPVDINNGTKSRISDFATMIKSFQSEINSKDAFSLAERIARSSGIMKELIDAKDKGPEEVERFQNVEELLSGIQEFSNSGDDENPHTLADFMLEVALLTDADQDKSEEKNHVSLMTIHSSKGLEFPNVYLVGMEENLFPSQMSLHSRSDLEEERRLFYVAVTRAMDSCTLSYAVSRFLWGQSISCEPSRFIDEIDSNYIEFSSKSKSLNRGLSMKGFEGARTGGLNKMSNPNLRSLKEVSKKKSTDTNNKNIKVGYNVEHQTFGKGKVTQMEGSGADQKATIFFPHHGSKTILLRFANLEILDEE
jgi:DNA helicase-2/ATP-dependent DNA helicase PcrA